MSDLKNGNGHVPGITYGSEGQQDKLPKSRSGSQRSARSLRATSATPNDAGTKPQPRNTYRSQTAPAPALSGHDVRPRRLPTMPVAETTTRQTKLSTSKAESTGTGPTRPPDIPNPYPEGKSSLDGTNYIIEPLPYEPRRSREQERQDSTHFSPAPAPSMPTPALTMPTPMIIPEARNSVSSFQTEPSTYYSAEDNLPSVGGGSSMPGGPSMPMPQTPQSRNEEQTSKNRYEELWLAAQLDLHAPSMPTPELGTPPMPSPYHVISPDGDSGEENLGERDEEDIYYNERSSNREPQPGESKSSNYVPPRDRYDSSWLAHPSPGMPTPSVASPPMPSPNANQPIPAPSSATPARIQPRPTSASMGTGAALGGVSSTAPLRIKHHLPPSGGASSTILPSTTTPTQSPPASPPSHLVSLQPSSPGLPRPQVDQPANLSSSALKLASAPQKSGYQQRPPGASAPMPPLTSTNAPQKPVSIYGQIPGANISVKPQGVPPTAPNTVTQSQVPQKVSNHHTQPISISNSNQSTQPTETAAVPPAVSSTAPQKPGANTSQLTPLRPQTQLSEKPPRPNTTLPPTALSNVTQKPNTSISQAQSTSPRPQAQIENAPPKKPFISRPQVQHQASTASSSRPEKQEASIRPPLRGGDQIHTQYVNMLLALDDIPPVYNILSQFFTWILLAGFILFPGTFTSLQNLNGGTSGISSQVEQRLINTVTHLPLFIVAWVCTGVGVIGMIWLAWRWRKNYLWGLNKIFLPGFLNSLAGFLSTIANVFGVQHGELVTTSKSTLIVTAAATGVLGIFVVFYTFWLVRRVKARHDKEVGKERAGKFGEGVVDLSKKR